MDLYDVSTWLFDAWSKQVDLDATWRGYVRARTSSGRVLLSVELPELVTADSAAGAAESVARDGTRSVELLRRGRSAPVDRYVVEAAAPAEGSNADRTLVECLARIVDRTIRANEELTKALIHESRAAAEIEGYAAGRQSAPEMREAVSIAANAFAARFSASQTPTALLDALLSDPVKAKSEWAKLPEEARTKYANALMTVVG